MIARGAAALCFARTMGCTGGDAGKSPVGSDPEPLEAVDTAEPDTGTYWHDRDGDGFGNPEISPTTGGERWVQNDPDCDD